ncbi:dihydrolipoamide acetyltransferase family protein [Nocardia carnea]|uniref:dihydrolipoamide acetyltransferase family protein n=1 Tax=Nocardia carnea TaxID=37328 RepID=UPI002454B0DB|nr:dihydrolipoamide acetyltransferase family protein [Nocardia carnea]
MDDAPTTESGEILEFRLPDLGEGLTDAELQNWTVAVGDEVALNQTIAEVETAKAVVALPSPFAGTVVELLAEPGATVEVGAPLLRIRTTAPASGGRTSVLVGYGPDTQDQPSRRRRRASGTVPREPRDGGISYQDGVIGAQGAESNAAEAAAGGHPDDGVRADQAGAGSVAAPDDSQRSRTGDGYAEKPAAVRGGEAGRRLVEAAGTERAADGYRAGRAGEAGRRTGETAGASSADKATDRYMAGSADAGTGEVGRGGGAAAPGARRAADGATGLGGGRVAATPGARKLARELGIDLWYVAGSGPGGAVTVSDVRGAVPVSEPDYRDRADAEAAAAEQPARGADREERTPISGVRKRTAAAMVASARTIPQASAASTVDITASLELLEHLRATKAFEGLTPTPLALVAKAVLAALAEYPGINTFWDEANSEIVTRYYVNLGIAVATDRGLLVPNIKDAQTLSLRELCREIGWLAQTARDGRAGLPDLRGGTFTISNVGVFGVDSGIPLVNPGEAAILCVGAVDRRPWVFRGELAVRSVVTLTLSFDHRMIDGELAARFLAAVAGALEDPLTLLARI